MHARILVQIDPHLLRRSGSQHRLQRYHSGRAMTKTNAARILDAAGIHYELREYEVDEDDLSAPRVAEKIGMPPEQVFKTLVARGDRSGVVMAAIPARS